MQIANLSSIFIGFISSTKEDIRIFTNVIQIDS